jgi:predicted metal-dependent enzyme (double-stranded beta helix superfamily)
MMRDAAGAPLLDRVPLTGAWDVEGLASWLARWRPPWEWLARFVAFDVGGYRRVPLLTAPAFEILLLAWLPGQATPIHSHGRSVGAVRLLVGELEERRYRPAAGGLLEVARTRFAAGAVLREGFGTVHRVEAVGRRPALSLHVYVPPLADPRTGGTDVSPSSGP